MAVDFYCDRGVVDHQLDSKKRESEQALRAEKDLIISLLIDILLHLCPLSRSDTGGL